MKPFRNSRQTLRLFLAGFSVLTLLGLYSVSPSGVAHAASDAECHDYASTAVAQQLENENLSCGLTGERWHTNQTAHFLFCKAFGDRAGPETSFREDLLEECRVANANRFQENEQIVGGEDNTNRFQENEQVITVRDCKPLLRSTVTHAEYSNASQLAPVKWSQDVALRDGGDYRDWENAEGKGIYCVVLNGEYECTARGRPCSN